MKKIGIIGGGVVSRLLVLEGRRMGFRFHLLDPDMYCPAHGVVDVHIVADTADENAIIRLASRVDLILCEDPAVREETVRAVVRSECPCFPCPVALERTRDQRKALEWMEGHGVLTTLACQAEPVRRFLIIGSRNLHGEIACYRPAVIEEGDGETGELLIPPEGDEEICRRAVGIMEDCLKVFELTGTACCELHLMKDGALAVRKLKTGPCLSGAYTKDICFTSHFEQHLRAVLGYAPGLTEQVRAAAFRFLIGEHEGYANVHGIREALRDPVRPSVRPPGPRR